MRIRKANLTDAQGIAKVHVDSWKSTYKNIISDEFLDKLSYDKRTDLWTRNISTDGDFIFVAENHEEKIVGFACCGKRETNHVANSGDLTAIYLFEENQGKGIGKQLMKQVFLQFEELGHNRVFVEVLEDNKTRYFYEHYGARLVRTEKITIAGAELSLLIYEWEDLKEVISKL